jgi:hypothetical protein
MGHSRFPTVASSNHLQGARVQERANHGGPAQLELNLCFVGGGMKRPQVGAVQSSRR